MNNLRCTEIRQQDAKLNVGNGKVSLLRNCKQPIEKSKNNIVSGGPGYPVAGNCQQSDAQKNKFLCPTIRKLHS